MLGGQGIANTAQVIFMNNILVKLFGDSILARIVLDVSSGRYRKLEPLNSLENEKMALDLDNCSHFGYTIGKAEKLIERQLKKGLSCQAMLLEYGGNDCNYDWKEIGLDPEADHQPNTPLDEFRQTYRRIIATLKRNGILPIAMNLPPIDADTFFDTWIKPDPNAELIHQWLGDKQHIYRWHELYSRTVEEIAREDDILLIDVRSAFLARKDFPELICSDGMHPTEKGHSLIIQSVRSFLEQLSPSTISRMLTAGASC